MMPRSNSPTAINTFKMRVHDQPRPAWSLTVGSVLGRQLWGKLAKLNSPINEPHRRFDISLTGSYGVRVEVGHAEVNVETNPLNKVAL